MTYKFKNVISTVDEFRALMGHPSELVTRKTIDYIDENCQLFIEQSPFVVISSSDKQGNFDVSPKGDPPGFIKILDSKTLVVPDRLGNKRADTFMNILQNPNVGIIFFVPGVKETLRVSGKAQIVTDEDLLEELAHNDKLPLFALIIHVEEVFFHCAKCIVRSKLWTSSESKEKRKIPSLAKAMVDHGKLEKSYQEMDEIIKDDELTRLY